ERERERERERRGFTRNDIANFFLTNLRGKVKHNEVYWFFARSKPSRHFLLQKAVPSERAKGKHGRHKGGEPLSASTAAFERHLGLQRGQRLQSGSDKCLHSGTSTCCD